MKLCKNCKHVLPDSVGNISDLSRCGYERPTSPVTGLLRAADTLPFAELERRTSGRCKPLAELWEAADHVMTPEEEEELMKGMPHV
jgi:hypothetical protein